MNVPLTKRCAFLFLNENEYSQHKHRDKEIQILTDLDSEKIDNYNKFLAKQAERFIFSYDDDFKELTKFIKGEISVKLEF